MEQIEQKVGELMAMASWSEMAKSVGLTAATVESNHGPFHIDIYGWCLTQNETNRVAKVIANIGHYNELEDLLRKRASAFAFDEWLRICEILMMKP